MIMNLFKIITIILAVALPLIISAFILFLPKSVMRSYDARAYTKKPLSPRARRSSAGGSVDIDEILRDIEQDEVAGETGGVAVAETRRVVATS